MADMETEKLLKSKSVRSPVIDPRDIGKERHALSELGRPPNGPRKPGKYFRILSIDGGGVRGIIPAMVIQYIEQRTGKKVPDLFNLVSGTSTGALLGMVLNIPEEESALNEKKKNLAKEKGDVVVGTPKYCSDHTLGLYMDECPKIFKTTIVQRLRNMGGLTSARYPAKVKREVVLKYAGNLKISDCLTDVLIPSFDVREGIPYIFKSTMAREGPQYNYRIADVLDATSAAPTYFKPRKVVGYDAKPELGYRSFIDGAVTANCPALCSVIEAVKVYKEKPDNIMVVSLGCGDADIGLPHEVVSRMGALGWATYIPSALISGSIYNVEQQADQILDDSNYWRFQTRVPANHGDIDDASKDNMEWLKMRGKELVRSEKKRLDKLCDLLLLGM